MSKLIYASLNERNKGVRLVGLLNSGSSKSYAFENFAGNDVTGSTVTGLTTPLFLSIARNNSSNMLFSNNSGASTVMAYYSTDKGNTFTSVGVNYAFSIQTCISDNGTFMLAARGTTAEAVRYSYDSGTNWTTRTTGLVDNGVGVSCSSDGTKVFGTSTSLTSAWLTTNSFSTTSTVTIPFSSYSSCMSGDGKRIYIQSQTSTVRIAYSTNDGSSWTTVTVDANKTAAGVAMRCSANGKHILLPSSGSYAFVSNDSGDTWTTVSGSFAEGLETVGCGVSRSGKYMVLSSSANGKYYYSKNFGRTWTARTVSGVAVRFRAIDIQEV